MYEVWHRNYSFFGHKFMKDKTWEFGFRISEITLKVEIAHDRGRSQGRYQGRFQSRFQGRFKFHICIAYYGEWW